MCQQWLERPYQTQYAENNKMQEWVNELLASDYDPSDYGNFMDSVNDLSISDAEPIEKALKQKDFAHLGKALWTLHVRKMTAKAESFAAVRLASTYQD